MVTLRQLSAICGVSVSTVSKALNGQWDVKEETAQRIRQVARDLGYYPNAAARSLKTNRSYNIGVLFADHINHEYFASILDSIRDAAKDHGYDITFISNQIGNSKISFYHHAAYRNFDGVIIAQAQFEDADVAQLAAGSLPVVVIDHVFPGRVSIMSENVQGMVEIIRYAAGMGHRKIAFIHGEEGRTVTQKRIEGFYKGCMESGIRAPEEYVIEAKYHNPKESGLATGKLLSLPSPPTCILYPDDYSYLGGLSEIEKHGLSIPEDISAIGYDGIYLSALLRPQLTTYRQDAEATGKAAVEKLIEQIGQPGANSDEQIFIKGSLQQGNSVKLLERPE